MRTRQHWRYVRDTGVKAKEDFERLIEPLRFVARQHGYALAVHGSLVRDIDVLAVAWTAEASTVFTLVGALVTEVRKRNQGIAYVDPPVPAVRPHGRFAWSIHLGGGPYIDLSVVGPAVARDAEYREWQRLYATQ